MENSVDNLTAAGYRVFGSLHQPFADPFDGLRIIGATRWSNRTCDFLVDLEGADQFTDNGVFNPLYPHWEYEFEFYPRPSLICDAQRMIHKYDAIIGHHSHVPQAVTCRETGQGSMHRRHLLAYSLGDFCFSGYLEQFQFGKILKVEFGEAAQGNIDIRQLEWHYTRCCQVDHTTSEVNLVASLPTIRELKPRLRKRVPKIAKKVLHNLRGVKT